MSTLLSRIGLVASQLQQEGKSPSLALVRARLGGGINPTELFTAYQSWRAQGSPMQQQPEVPASSTRLVAVDTPADLQADIARLEHKLDLILQLLQSKS